MSGSVSRDEPTSVPVDDGVTVRRADEADREFLTGLLEKPPVRRRIATTAGAELLPDPGPGDGEQHQDEDDRSERLVVRAAGDRVGTVALLGITPAFGTAEVGYAVEPDHWGNGYATAAVRRVVDHAFDERGLSKLHGFVLASNDASRRVLEKVGFEREGTRRDEAVGDGEDVALHRYGLAADVR